ncbi:hypothetical protein ACFQS2_00040 [Brachybacterium sp. GCM10030267]
MTDLAARPAFTDYQRGRAAWRRTGIRNTEFRRVIHRLDALMEEELTEG